MRAVAAVGHYRTDSSTHFNLFLEIGYLFGLLFCSLRLRLHKELRCLFFELTESLFLIDETLGHEYSSLLLLLLLLATLNGFDGFSIFVEMRRKAT